MTVLTDLVHAQPASISLPFELIEAGKLPGTTVPATANPGITQVAMAGSVQAESDLIVDLTKMSVLSAACGTFVPPVGYVELGSILGVAHRSGLDMLGEISRTDLVPHFASLGGRRGG